MPCCGTARTAPGALSVSAGMHPRVTLPTALAACAAVTSSRWEHCKACQCCELPVHGAASHSRPQCPGRRPAPRRTCSCAALPMRSATGAPRPAPAAPPAPLPMPHAPARALRTHSATRVRACKGSGKPGPWLRRRDARRRQRSYWTRGHAADHAADAARALTRLRNQELGRGACYKLRPYRRPAAHAILGTSFWVRKAGRL